MNSRAFAFVVDPQIDISNSFATFLRRIFWLHQYCKHYFNCPNCGLLPYFGLDNWIHYDLFFLVMQHFAYQINIHFQQNSLWIYLSIFVVAWIGQFYGHKIEGKKPNFMKDLQFLLTGTSGMLHFFLKKVGMKY